MCAALAIDIGGTKMAAAVVSEDGGLLASDRIATSPSADAEGLVASLEDLCRALIGASGASISAIGVGCGGPMQYPAGIVSPLNIPAWRDFPLRARLSAAF